MSKDLHDLGFNLLGGILVIILDRVIIYAKIIIKGFLFKQIFGNVETDYYIVYGKMILKPEYSTIDKFPYLKPNAKGQFNMTSPVSFAETRAAKYISESFSKSLNKSPLLVSDDEIKEKIDISYCSLGGYNNHKTIQIVESKDNVFYKFDFTAPGSIINKINKKVFNVDGTYDYAVIIKIKNRLFPNRIQICVAGLGEWGTSGGSWFIANKWNEIRKKVGSKSFGAVIKVKGGSDESADLIDILM